jgi:hypothetical protein
MCRFRRRAGEMRLCEWLLLELSRAIEADDGADDHVADFELLADAARGSSRDDQLGLHFEDDLAPYVDIWQLRTILRQAG